MDLCFTMQNHLFKPETPVPDAIHQQIELAESSDDRQFITALARGLSLLSIFRNSDTILTHQAICQRTGLPKATVSRLIYTLLKTQFLSADHAGGYRLGINSIQLSAAAWAQYDITRHAQPLMAAFAAENQVSVSLAKEEAGKMLCLSTCHSPARQAIHLAVGIKVPLFCTAIGRAYFALADNIQRQHLARSLAALDTISHNQQWQTLLQHDHYFHQHGYTLSNGDFSTDILSIAVGIYNKAEARFTHAINACVPAIRWHIDDFTRDIAPRLQQLAEQISINA